MKTYHNHRAEPYFTFVREGLKTIEVRLQKGKYNLIKPDDHIIVYNEEETDSFEVKVKRATKYKTIKDLITAEGIEKVVPDARSFEEAINIPYLFYTKDQEKEFGMVAIEVEVVKKP